MKNPFQKFVCKSKNAQINCLQTSNKSGSAMRTCVDFHLFLIMNNGMSQCTVSVRP